MPLILLAIGLGLIIYNYRVIKKEDKIKQGNDGPSVSFERVFQDSKEDLDDYKIEIGLLRKDIGESLTELQEEILEIKNNVNKLNKSEKLSENEDDVEITNFIFNEYNKSEDNLPEENIDEVNVDLPDDVELNAGVISEINFSEKEDSNKTQNIKKLLEDGLTEEQICHELSVSKGEVLLVKGLFKK